MKRFARFRCWCWSSGCFKWLLVGAYIFYEGSSVLAALVGINPSPTVYRTIALTELVWVLICWPTGVVLLVNLLDVREDGRALARRGAPESLRERVRANLRNESQRAWSDTVFLIVGGLVMLTPPPAVPEVGVVAVLATNLFVSMVLAKAYCSIMDRADRRRDAERRRAGRFGGTAAQ